MPDNYYIDLYFDPARYTFRQTVQSCVNAVMEAGCSYERATMSGPGAERSVSLGEHVALGPGDLPDVAVAYAAEAAQEGQRIIPFPPLGRIVFSHPFRYDEDTLEDIHEEEDDSHSSCDDIGLAFLYTVPGREGGNIKASLNFWEEYVITGGSPDLQVENMRDILGIIKRISASTPPYFGAMNTELHLDTDASMELLMADRLPEGNEFAIVGGTLINKLNMDSVRKKYPVASLPGGGAIIQMADKWKGLNPF